MSYLVERERERESSYPPVSKTNQGLDLSGFQFIFSAENPMQFL